MKKTFILFLILSSATLAKAQTNQQSGWFYWLGSFKLKDKFSAHFDLQLRSADDWEQIQTLILRPGLTYNFNSKQNATLGYALIGTFLKVEGGNANRTEHRIWQQFIQTHKISKAFATHRFRLEQRFIEGSGQSNLFSQRLRYFARFVVPLVKYDGTFARGPYLALQNEAFFHLQNKDKLNGSFFDQNRAYVAAGIRLSKKVDLEAGYLNQYSKGIAANTTNNVIQLGILSRL